MKRFLFILLILTNIILSYGQSDTSIVNSHSLQFGMGSLGYMNNFFIPAGLKGANLSSIYTFKSSGNPAKKGITYLNIRMDYSRLFNSYGEESLMHPTHLYYLNLNLEKLFPVYNHNNNFKVSLGLNTGINLDFCINNFYSYESFYSTPPFGGWNSYAGISSLIRFKIGNFIIENKSAFPCLFYGFFPKYGYSLDGTNSLFYLKNLQFTSVMRYVKPENYFTVYYSGFRLKNIPGSFFFSYAYLSHWSDVDNNIQKYRKNTFYIGLIIN
jgi:hypothetical protein